MIDLTGFDIILVNSSAGKDSMAALDLIASTAHRQGVLERVVVGHADLGRVEWPHTRSLAEQQADRYGLRFETVAARGPDLLGRVERRGMWPSAQQRWCTSDLKRGPLRRLMTRLVSERRRTPNPRRMRLLNVMGMRAEESPARARKPVVEVDRYASNGRREVVNFLDRLTPVAPRRPLRPRRERARSPMLDSDLRLRSELRLGRNHTALRA